jgi:serine phosphatase RsbU (regulator of sigma subunit)
MYTDGISEATSPKDQMYGPQRVSAVVQNSSGGAELIGSALLDDVQKFMSDQPQSDDICLLCFERLAD